MALALLSFDLDGTLVDTIGEIAEAANRALQEHGLPRQPEAQVALLIGHGGHELMRKLLAHLQAQVDDALVFASFERHYVDTTGTIGQPYPGAAEALELLRSRDLLMACVTNKDLRHAQRLLAHHGLQDYFDLVIGGDSLPQKKPDPAVLRHVAATFRIPLHRMAHVGDSATDVEAARNAGVRAWAVPYGYNAGRPIAEAAPDIVFPDLLAVAHAALQA